MSAQIRFLSFKQVKRECITQQSHVSVSGTLLKESLLPLGRWSDES